MPTVTLWTEQWRTDLYNTSRGGFRKFRKREPRTPPPLLWMKTSLLRTCSYKVLLTFQKHFEIARKRGGGAAALSAPPLNPPMTSKRAWSRHRWVAWLRWGQCSFWIWAAWKGVCSRWRLFRTKNEHLPWSALQSLQPGWEIIANFIFPFGSFFDKE